MILTASVREFNLLLPFAKADDLVGSQFIVAMGAADPLLVLI